SRLPSQRLKTLFAFWKKNRRNGRLCLCWPGPTANQPAPPGWVKKLVSLLFGFDINGANSVNSRFPGNLGELPEISTRTKQHFPELTGLNLPKISWKMIWVSAASVGRLR